MASEIKVNKISPESGTTLTLGDSGDTINFGSGVLPNFENLTVTGDLTVDTNSLKVDSTNNFVGIGTASPSFALDVAGNARANYFALRANESAPAETSFVYRPATGTLAFGTASTERMRIDSSGNVGIGTTSPLRELDVTSATAEIAINSTGSSYSRVNHYHNGTALWTTGTRAASDYHIYRESGTGNVIINNGLVGIGTTSPSNVLDIESSTQYKGLEISNGTNTIAELIGFGTGNDAGGLKLRNGGTATVEIQSSGTSYLNGGKVGIGTSSPLGGGNALTVKRGSTSYNPTNTGYASYIYHASNTSTAHGLLVANNWMASASKLISAISINAANGAETTRFEVDGIGNTSITGSLSKGSGSFKIDHPLPSKTETHHLVHSFVEAPQADNIYRGKIDLVNGTATVNIDTVAGMTEGTFVLLNTNIQCFTTNETGWTAVKGSVSGNILTITAQDNTCTDTISWMVIGERQDQHMIDTSWTDENGKVIVEPLKNNNIGE